MASNRLVALLVAAVALVATPAYAANNPKAQPDWQFRCPGQDTGTARIWLEEGKRWSADNQCGRGSWLSIAWNGPGSSDSNTELLLVAPKTRFGPRKSGSIPGPGGWVNARMTSNPEFHGCVSESTWVVWPDSKGVFDVTC